MSNSYSTSELMVSSSQFVNEEKYWLNKLSGELVKSTFIYDFEETYGESAAPTGIEKFKFSREVLSRLLKITRGSNAKIHMFLVAGLAALLGKYSYTDTPGRDILVGIPIYRQETESEFINTVLSIRILFDDRTTFKELILQVRQTVTEANENANYSIETLLYQLKMPLSETGFPLFDTALLLENIHSKDYLKHIRLNMIFSFLRTDDSIEGVLEYNSSLFKKSTVETVINRFVHLVGEALFHIDRPVGDIKIFTEREKKKLLYDFNNTGKKYSDDKTIHWLLEEQVTRTPDRIALVYENQCLTYSELNKRSTQLACFLSNRGVTADVIVAIMVERSIEMIIGLFGIMKAGGAFLPIDPFYPEDRIRYILEDSGTEIGVVDNNSMNDRNLPAAVSTLVNLNAPPVYPDNETGSIDTVDSSNLAYVIYTSGTTGRPKGALIEHRSAVNTLLCRKEEYRVSPADTALQFFSYSFDGFVTSFFTPVLSGAEVVLLSEEAVLDMAKIKETIIKRQVTQFINVPMMYREIMENLTVEEAASLKLVILAGDKVSSGIFEITKQKNRNIEIVNEYGVTEAAVMSTICRNLEKHSEINIGKPAWNTKIYILDRQNRLQAAGIWGELSIAGAGLARGYLNNSSLTVEKFIPDPFIEGERNYRSGDLARWLPDGSIEFLGRVDHQVKIRGIRIELGEIEKQLKNHPEIKEAVVSVKMDVEKNEDKYICAYITSGKDLSTSVSELREHLLKALPDYMVPMHFFQIEGIPLNPNGKIDRKNLDSYGKSLGSGVEFVAPTKKVEEIVAGIWKAELNVVRVGINDNFFDIGGNSLKVMHVNSKLKDILERDVPIVSMFQYPTVRTFCKYLEREKKGETFFDSEEELKALNNVQDLLDETLQIFTEKTDEE